MTVIKQIRNPAILAALAVGHSVAIAQSIPPVVITYGPADVASVPTLSHWGMIIMSGLLAVVAVIAIRKNAGSKTVMSIALAAVVAFGGGTYALKEAIAAPGFLPMNNPAGGSITTDPGNTPTQVRNNTSVRLKIFSVSPPTALDNNNTACVPGVTVLAPTENCTVLTDGSGLPID